MRLLLPLLFLHSSHIVQGQSNPYLCKIPANYIPSPTTKSANWGQNTGESGWNRVHVAKQSDVDGRLDSGSGATWLFLLPVHPIFNAALRWWWDVKVVFSAPCHCIVVKMSLFSPQKMKLKTEAKKRFHPILSLTFFCYAMACVFSK